MPTKEAPLTPEGQEKRTLWLKDLANFIVEANTKTWAAGGAEVEPQRPGYQELEWPLASERSDWYLRDSYTGYFRAPGTTTIYYKDKTAWAMSYGGHGMEERHYNRVKTTFSFLQEALMRVSAQLPFRGPLSYRDRDMEYTFQLESGDITDCRWTEWVRERRKFLFTQTGFAGIVIHKTDDEKPLYPWDF